MKRAVITAVLFGAVAALSGCPIYTHEDDGCYHDNDCAPGYVCDKDSGDCYLPGHGSSCTRPNQCAASQTCSSAGVCLSGDCSFHGCVRGYECDSSSGTWTCVAPMSGAAGGPSEQQSSDAGSAGTSSESDSSASAGSSGSAG